MTVASASTLRFPCTRSLLRRFSSTCSLLWLLFSSTLRPPPPAWGPELGPPAGRGGTRPLGRDPVRTPIPWGVGVEGEVGVEVGVEVEVGARAPTSGVCAGRRHGGPFPFSRSGICAGNPEHTGLTGSTDD